jgi:hypothetical protein
MSSNYKVWLCIITNDKELDNINELTSVWESFDGIFCVVHKQGGDNKVKELLESRKKEGEIIERNYLYHNGHSMNEFLLNPKIKLGDFLILRDSTERLNVNFCKNIRNFIDSLKQNGIGSVYQRSKLLMFKRWFNQQFFNGLHWGLFGARQNMIAIDQIIPNDYEYAYSLRDQLRPKHHRYRHEAYYLINYGVNGNHLQLFNTNPQELEIHQNEFAKFLQFLEGLGICDVDKWGEFLKVNPLDEAMKYHINLERPLRNYYRYFILKHSDEEIKKDENEWRIQ